MLRLTSNNNDSIVEMESFYLTSITKQAKSIPFKKPKRINGKFIFDNIKPDTYIGLMTIKKDNAKYNITIDSIVIKKGTTEVAKEVNLGSISL